MLTEAVDILGPSPALKDPALGGGGRKITSSCTVCVMACGACKLRDAVVQGREVPLRKRQQNL